MNFPASLEAAGIPLPKVVRYMTVKVTAIMQDVTDVDHIPILAMSVEDNAGDRVQPRPQSWHGRG